MIIIENRGGMDIYCRRKTQEEFVKEVDSLTCGEYIVVGTYKNARTKVLMKHVDCGRSWMVTPNNFLSEGSRCPKCKAEDMRKTQETAEKQLYDAVGDEYTILGKYINSETKVRMKHNVCGYQWNVLLNSVLRGTRCPKCYKESLKKG